MILHLTYDEKVINRAIENFEYVFPNQNKFVVLSKGRKSPKYATNNKALFCKYDTPEFWENVGDTRMYKSIVLHLLLKETADFVCKIQHPNIYWIEWGGDLYNQLLQIRGYKLYHNNDDLWRMSHIRLPKYIYKIAKVISLYINEQKIIRAAKKIRYFVPDSMYDEIELIKQYYPELSHLQYKNFYYYPIDEVVQPELFEQRCVGNNVIVGNSAAISGNHRMVFEKLSKIDNIGGKIICPLSYGNNKYARAINELGVSIWGDRFIGIKDFLPLDEYNKLFLSANTFIYGNWRQEAVGNILVSLFLGGRVFLDIRNPLYSFYQRCGIIIFPLHSIDNINILSKLTSEQIEHNRNILLKMYSRENLYTLIKENFLC